jgi:uncharacterized membrane protein YkoI
MSYTNALRTVAAAGLLAVVSAGAAVAQQPTAQATAKHQAAPKKSAMGGAKHESQKSLRAEAKVSEDSARKVALAQVPGGKVSKHELERENGKLLYSYDIKVAGKSGVDEVQVDAITGAVLSNKHETPAMEKKEAAAEAKEKSAMKHSAKTAAPAKKP